MTKRPTIPEDGFLRFVIDVLVNSVIIIALFFFVQKVIAAPFQVIGSSMYDTLHQGEYIVVSKLEYLFGDPQRGDIVVFHPPHQEEEYYIKRIIGIPGDKIELKAGDVYVNGTKVEEVYLREGLKTCAMARNKDCSSDDKVYEVPEGKYFVMGDNRSGSSDSREWFNSDNVPEPFVHRDQIQGKTRVVLYPLPDIRLIPETSVFEAVGM